MAQDKAPAPPIVRITPEQVNRLSNSEKDLKIAQLEVKAAEQAHLIQQLMIKAELCSDANIPWKVCDIKQDGTPAIATPTPTKP